MKNVLALFVVALAGIVLPANSQVWSPNGWNSALNRAMAPVAAQWYVNRAYSPVDYAINNAPIGYSGGSRVAVTVGSAVSGAAIGGSFGGTRGALIGAGAGAEMAVLATSFHGRGHAFAGPTGNSRNSNSDFSLANNTSAPIEVYFHDEKGKERRVGKHPLMPGETWNVKGAKPNREWYLGFPIVTNNRGGTSTYEMRPISDGGSGWVFVEPNCCQQGGGR